MKSKRKIPSHIRERIQKALEHAEWMTVADSPCCFPEDVKKLCASYVENYIVWQLRMVLEWDSQKKGDQ